eukprot:TRINITY_DN3365_c0_g1_i3.p1 TRINITY_DN3365_c0_g1~~TRINITY_DN3365_c0_g1_i3.p1  ORF type:complete len:597 (+),score=151.48 TRINITY_DN3365_c0_g1_i3:160-1791(+)
MEAVSCQVVASGLWEHWKDMLEPRQRHGIIMGKQPDELMASWPRDESAYPSGHPPVVPPGCCGRHCTCMDGTRRPEGNDIRKSWLDDDSEEARCRAMSALQSVQALASRPFAMRRGRVSRQNFIEPSQEMESKSTTVSSSLPKGNVEEAARRPLLDELAQLLASAIRDALASTPAGAFANEGLLLPLGPLVAATGLDAGYAPLRVKGLSEAFKIRWDPLGGRAFASASASSISGSQLKLQLVFPEGNVAVDACRVVAASLEQPVSRLWHDAVATVADKLSWPPLRSIRGPLQEALGAVWDFQTGTMRELSFREVLKCLEQLRMMVSSAAVSHLSLPSSEAPSSSDQVHMPQMPASPSEPTGGSAPAFPMQGGWPPTSFPLGFPPLTMLPGFGCPPCSASGSSTLRGFQVPADAMPSHCENTLGGAGLPMQLASSVQHVSFKGPPPSLVRQESGGEQQQQQQQHWPPMKQPPPISMAKQQLSGVPGVKAPQPAAVDLPISGGPLRGLACAQRAALREDSATLPHVGLMQAGLMTASAKWGGTQG